jgi:hypothetical protein
MYRGKNGPRSGHSPRDRNRRRGGIRRAFAARTRSPPTRTSAAAGRADTSVPRRRNPADSRRHSPRQSAPARSAGPVRRGGGNDHPAAGSLRAQARAPARSRRSLRRPRPHGSRSPVESRESFASQQKDAPERPSRSQPSRYLSVVAIFHSHHGALKPSATTHAKL